MPSRDPTPTFSGISATGYDVRFNDNTTIESNTLLSAPYACNTTRSDVDQLNFYLNGFGTMAVIVLGVLGNSMAMVVLTRRTMRTSTNIFLTALAIWDTVVLLVCLPLISLKEMSIPFREEVFPYIVVYLYPVGLVAQTATVWITVTFTVERYIAVCYPLRAVSMCTVPRARLLVFSISIVSILYNLPRWFEYSITSVTDIYSLTCVYPDKTPLGRDSIYHRIYFGWLYFLVMCFIPLCSLTILNSCLAIAVRKSRQQRKDMNVRQSRENNVTIMLVSVVMVFIICQVPALIYNTAYAIDMQRVVASRGWRILSHLRNALVTLNSAVNFILYCTLGEKFRRTFVRTFCPCLVRKMPGRFQSFSCHQNNVGILKARAGFDNGGSSNESKEVNYYKQCTTKSPDAIDQDCIDMKEIKPKLHPKHSIDYNSSAEHETVALFDTEGKPQSHTHLLNNKNRINKKPR